MDNQKFTNKLMWDWGWCHTRMRHDDRFVS